MLGLTKHVKLRSHPPNFDNLILFVGCREQRETHIWVTTPPQLCEPLSNTGHETTPLTHKKKTQIMIYTFI